MENRPVWEFIEALTEDRNTFLRLALLTGVLASIACGIVGSYVVTRRISYLAGGIAHCVLGGMGAARYCQAALGWQWAHPLFGAVLSAVGAAMLIGYVSLRAKEREDTVIGAFWAIGMAVGILFISKTPGYNQELMSYLFGNLLMVTRSNLWLIVVLDGVVLAVSSICYNRFVAVCFDAEFALLRGLRLDAYYLALLCLTALTVVLLVSVVGIVMVIALLTIPAAIAGRFARSLWQMMLLAIGLSMVFTVGGLAASYGPDLPAGAITILLAGSAYLLVLMVGRVVRKRASTTS